MKMVKSLLLGTAAGLVAMTGAQAADLPVKAKPVQYVKICSLYGAGFYYIPGTDTCIKVGGFVRNESGYNAGGSYATYVNGTQALYDRAQETWTTRTRTAMTLDVREQTEYGTLRAYMRGGFQWSTADNITSNNNITYFDRGFIQFAGFTTGKTASFYDFHSHPTYSYQTQLLAGESGGAGTNVFGYTAQLGNGLSATIAAEDSSFRRAPVINNTAALSTFNTANAATEPRGSIAPEVVANLRIDQAWGSAQVQGAAHLVGAQRTGTSQIVHPSDKWGTAVGVGASFNLPMLGKGDTFSVGANWANGAVRYVSNPGVTNGTGMVFGLRQGNTIAMGEVVDGTIDVAGTGIDLSQAWSISGGYQHFWSPKWRTGVYGQYMNFKQSSATVDALCVAGGQAAGCQDFKGYQIGTRTQWNPVSNLDVGIDLMYTRANTAQNGRVISVVSNGGAASTATAGDIGVWSAFFRVQRNFYP